MAVLITGASSGLGAALAVACAQPGAVLHLGGRDAARLAATAAACRARGAEARESVADVTEAEAMARWVAAAGEPRLVIANAGVSAGPGGGTEDPARAREVFAVNLGGVLNLALPALEAMAALPPGPDGVRGRLVVVASLAAFVANPGAPAYCASKAAAQRWAEAADATWRRRGVRVHAACPGFIRTRMTARNPFPMPGLMEPEDAARRILRGVERGRTRIAFPLGLYWATRAAGALPPAWRNALLSRAPAKPAG